MTRHEARFDITSFIYRARRPFHPGRLPDLVLDPFFSKVDVEEEEDEMSEEEKADQLKKLQEEASRKQVQRTKTMGQLLRSKGFLWIATSHDIIGGWQQAGNIIHLEAEQPWMCLSREMWQDTESAELILKDIEQKNGEEWKYADRRQELVFIGQGLKHEAIQKLLDQCLLDDEEMEMGPEKWEEEFADVDKLQLDLGDDDEGEEEEEEEEEGVGEEEGENDGAKEEKGVESSPGPVRKKAKNK